MMLSDAGTPSNYTDGQLANVAHYMNMKGIIASVLVNSCRLPDPPQLHGLHAQRSKAQGLSVEAPPA